MFSSLLTKCFVLRFFHLYKVSMLFNFGQEPDIYGRLSPSVAQSPAKTKLPLAERLLHVCVSKYFASCVKFFFYVMKIFLVVLVLVW